MISTSDEMKPCPTDIKVAKAAMRDPIFGTADDILGRALARAEYRKNNSEIARCLIRLVAAWNTRSTPHNIQEGE